MSPIGILDCLSLVIILTGLLVFLARRPAIGRDARMLFIGLLILTLFRNFSNVLEWTGITPVVGLYEEYVEILSPLLWVFFFYAFIRQKAEEAVQDSEDRYRTLVESSPTAIYIRKGDSFQFVNKRLVDATGYSREELLSMSLFDLVHPDDREYAQRLAALRESGKGAEGRPQYRILTKDGEISWVETHGGVNIEYEGEPAVLSSIIEITDRKKAEEALRESEDRHRSIVEAATDMIITIDLNTGVIRSANAIAEELLGHKREDIVNKVSFQELLHPDEHERALKNMQERVQEDKRYPNSPFRIRKSDGSYLHTEINGGVLLDSGGNPSQYLALIRDVTGRKLAEEKRRESEERYRILVENSLTGVYIIQDGRFQFVSSRLAEMLGHTREELLELSIEQVMHPEDMQQTRELTKQRLAGAPPFRPRFRVLTKTGDLRWVQAFGAVIEYQGKPAVLGNIIDITEQRKAEEERRNLEKQIQHTQKLESLGVLAGGIAHDFNNLLTSILGHADLAGMMLSSASPARDNLKEIETASRRAAELCSQMLAYSGKGKFLIEAVSLNEAVEEMAHLLQISISKKAVLRYNFADNLPFIEADATQIRQVVMNLITNASEAIGEKSGSISISTGAMECDSGYLEKTYLAAKGADGVYVYLEVSDSGDGMDAETLDKIFDPFFSTKFTGRGLGLAAVQGIVRGHGGAIKVDSEPGKGTTFKVLFPAANLPAKPLTKDTAKAEDWRGSGTVLLVDDEDTVRTVGKSMLAAMGFDTITADDGHDAVEKFREHADEITLVLLDLTMPHMSGEEAFREIKRIRTDARIILSSGYSEQEATDRFTGKGLAGFVQKPYQYQTLVEKIRAALGDQS